MRAEEGDESVEDYAAEGKQTMGKIKSTQRGAGRLGDVARRFAKLWGGRDHPPSGTTG